MTLLYINNGGGEEITSLPLIEHQLWGFVQHFEK